MFLNIVILQKIYFNDFDHESEDFCDSQNNISGNSKFFLDDSIFQKKSAEKIVEEKAMKN